MANLWVWQKFIAGYNLQCSDMRTVGVTDLFQIAIRQIIFLTTLHRLTHRLHSLESTVQSVILKSALPIFPY